MFDECTVRFLGHSLAFFVYPKVLWTHCIFVCEFNLLLNKFSSFVSSHFFSFMWLNLFSFSARYGCFLCVIYCHHVLWCCWALVKGALQIFLIHRWNCLPWSNQYIVMHATVPRVGPGHPLSPLSIYFLIFSPFHFSLSFIGSTYFLLLSIPSLSTRIVPLRFQAGGRRRRPNLVLVFLCFTCVICIP